MNRRLPLAMTTAACLVLVFVSSSHAVDRIAVTSMWVASGETGVVVPILMSNDVTISSVVVPLVLREITVGSYVANSLTMTFADRLPSGGPLSFIRTTNWYTTEDGNCKSGQPGGFGTLTETDGSFAGPFVSPQAVEFSALSLGPIGALPPGSDVTGSMVLTFDVTATPGDFEIDTTCVDPAGHLAFVQVPTANVVPNFLKGTISIMDCPCWGVDLDHNDLLDAVDIAREIDCVFFGGICGSIYIGPNCPVWLGDFDGDTVPDATDLALLIDHVFFGGSGPFDPCL